MFLSILVWWLSSFFCIVFSFWTGATWVPAADVRRLLELTPKPHFYNLQVSSKFTSWNLEGNRSSGSEFKRKKRFSYKLKWAKNVFEIQKLCESPPQRLLSPRKALGTHLNSLNYLYFPFRQGRKKQQLFLHIKFIVNDKPFLYKQNSLRIA